MEVIPAVKRPPGDAELVQRSLGSDCNRCQAARTAFIDNETDKWLILAFNQPDNLDEQLSDFVNQEWQNVCSRLNVGDINEGRQGDEIDLTVLAAPFPTEWGAQRRHFGFTNPQLLQS